MPDRLYWNIPPYRTPVHVDIFAGCQHVIKTAVTDIVSPAVAAENPHGRFGQHICVFYYVFRVLRLLSARAFTGSCQQYFSRCSRSALPSSIAASHAFAASLQTPDVSYTSFDCRTSSSFLLALTEIAIPITEFRVIFKQGVCPCRASALFVHGIRCRSAQQQPQIEEQPVAFAINIRSPNNCVTSFA